MGRKPVDKTCSVCLNNASTNSYRLSKKDENELTLYTKLKTCVSEIVSTVFIKIFFKNELRAFFFNKFC